MNVAKPKILITVSENGNNGGPYISHMRIMSDPFLNNIYEFEKIEVPRARKLFNPFGLIYFMAKIKKSKPNIVHIAGLQLEGFFPMLACKLLGIKTVLAIHGSASEAQNIRNISKFFYSIFETYTVKHASIVYGVSDYVSSWKICKKSKKYYGTIYNIPDFLNKGSVKENVRNELNLSRNDFVVTSTGRITRDKGFDTLLQVILTLKEFQNIKFVIAGDGKYKNEFERKINEKNLSNKVFVLGYRSDIQNILSCSDAFIICTRHETLCISLLESAYMKLPLIASNVGGVPEIIDSSCGFLVEPSNILGFKNAILDLYYNCSKRNEMGLNAYNKVIKKFSKESIENKINEVYQTIIKD